VARPLSGALVGVALSLPFAIDAATAAISAALIATIPGSFRTPRDPDATPPTMRRQIGDGLRWLWKHRLLRTLAIALGIMNGLSAAIMATFVLFAQEILTLDGLGFGLLLAAGSVGGLLGSLLAPNLTARMGAGPSLTSTIAVPIVAMGTIAVTSNPWVAGLGFAVGTFTAIMWNVVTVSLRQVLIPDELLGRVNSVYRFFGWGAMPIGTLLGGGLVAVVEQLGTRELGLRAPFLLVAVVHVVLLAVVAPRLRTATIDQARADAGVGDGHR
jgi:MFS family permease